MIRHLGLFNNRTERDAALDEGTLQEPFIVYYTETVQTTITQTVEDDDIPEIQHYTPNNPEPEPVPEEPYVDIYFDVDYLDVDTQTGNVERIDYGNFDDLATILLFKYKASDLAKALAQDQTLNVVGWKLDNALIETISVDDDSLDNYLPIELTYDPDFTPFTGDESADAWMIELHMLDSNSQTIMTKDGALTMLPAEEEPEEPEGLFRMYTDVDYMTEAMMQEDDTAGSVYLEIVDEDFANKCSRVDFYLYDTQSLEDARNLAMQEGVDFDEEEFISGCTNGDYTAAALTSQFASEDGGPIYLSYIGWWGAPTIVNTVFYIMKVYKTVKGVDTLVQEQTVSIEMDPMPEPPVEDPEPPVE